MAKATRGGRWAVYGTNVALAAAAAVALAVLINVLVYWHMPRQALRFDLTATRRYSLSQQTRKVLAGLPGEYRLIALVASSDPQVEQIVDLTQEYAARSAAIRAQQIIAGAQLSREDALYAELHGRHASQLQPLRGALEKSQGALDRFVETAGVLAASLRQPVAQPGMASEGTLGAWLQQAAGVFAATQGAVQQQSAALGRSLRGSLPDYDSLRDEQITLLTGLDVRLLTPSLQQIGQRISAAETPADVKETLLKATDQLGHLRQEVQAALAGLQQARAPEEYHELVKQLGTPTTYGYVLVVGPSRVRVLPMDNMFQRGRSPTAADARQVEQQFLGEEQITGALIAMSLRAPPLVVFVGSSGQDPIEAGGVYGNVADRLRALNFEVKSWSPAGAPGPMGEAQGPQPAPQAKEGQAAVWVVVGPLPASPMNPAPGAAETQVAEFARQRLAEGQGVLLLLSVSPSYEFQPSALADVLTGLGVSAQLDRAVLRQQKQQAGQASADYRHFVSQWPQDLPITRALGGMPGLFVLPSPMSVKAVEGVQAKPLVVVSGPAIWAAPFHGTEDLTTAKLDPNTAPPDGKFTVGYAIEKGGERLVVVADPLWATDTVTTFGQIAGISAGPGLAQWAGASFPANAELFVNSVEWLAHLDDLIAASPRTQDVRRFGKLSPAALAATRWGLVAGMPAAAALLGVVVWVVRRRP